MAGETARGCIYPTNGSTAREHESVSVRLIHREIDEMKAEDVKRLLPVIEAFANKQPVYFQVTRYDKPGEWRQINPETTEFRLSDLTDSDINWRVDSDE